MLDTGSLSHVKKIVNNKDKEKLESTGVDFVEDQEATSKDKRLFIEHRFNLKSGSINIMASQLPPQMQVDAMSSGTQFREFLSQYNKITEQCFQACVHDFTTRRVLGAEESCAFNCLEKYMKMTNRISQRFQEYQLASNDQLAAAQGKSS